MITQLIDEGLLVVHPGLGTIAAAPPSSTTAERRNLLRKDLEQLAVEAKKLGLDLEDVFDALAEHWSRLEGSTSRTAQEKGARRRS